MALLTDPDALADHPLGHARPVWRDHLPIALAALPFVLLPLVVGDSRTYMGVASAVVVAAGYATGFNLVFGMTGQLLLCVGALGAVGGYGTAILADDLGLPTVVAVVLAVAICSALGAVFCWLSVRRSLDVIFTGIVTLAFALAVENLLLARRDLTGGEDGRGVDAADGTLLRELVGGYYALVVVVLLFLVAFRWLERSHHGWAYRALRDDGVAARLAGVDVARHRVHAGALGAAMMGTVGAVDALVTGRLTPDVHRFTVVDVESLVIVALGGIGTVLAPVVGAVVLGLLDEFVLRGLGTLRVVVLGAILLTLFLALRDGIAGVVQRARVGGGGGPGAATDAVED